MSSSTARQRVSGRAPSAEPTVELTIKIPCSVYETLKTVAKADKRSVHRECIEAIAAAIAGSPAQEAVWSGKLTWSEVNAAAERLVDCAGR